VPDDPKPTPDTVFIVFGGGIVLAVYRGTSADSAELHKRCVTGASVTSAEIIDRVPEEILKDLDVEFAGEDEDDTPVQPRTFTVEDLDDSK
jgi:hypothetical protein